MWSMLVSVALAAPFNTSGYNGAPGSLAGFDAFGDPTDIDPGPVVRGVLDDEVQQPDNRIEEECEDVIAEQFDARAEADRDSVAFVEDTAQICLDVIGDVVPGMIEGYLPTVTGIVDAAIAAQVPALVVEYGECACEAEIDAAIAEALAVGVPGATAWKLGSTEQANQRVSWSSVGGGSMTATGFSQSFGYFAPFEEETAGRTYAGISVYVTAAVSGTHSVGLSVYSVVDGVPVETIAVCGGISTATLGEKYADFSADCIPTTIGAAYFDGAGDLSLAFGDAIALEVSATAITNLRTFAAGSVRPIGWPVAGGGLAPYGGWKVPVASMGATIASSALQPVNVGNVPAIWLDPI